MSPLPVLHLDGFDGPMDLLLELAERRRIDLGRMSVRTLAEQFVAAMERLVGTVPIGRRADWLVVATRLVLLRSRLLRPATPEAAATAERDAAAELRRIGELAAMRQAATWLQARPQLGIDAFARPKPEAPWREGGYVALMEACLVVLRHQAGRVEEDAACCRAAVRDLWRLPDALAHVRAALAGHPEGGDLAGFLPPVAPDDQDRPLKARAALASTLLAGLELAKEGTAQVMQDEMFGAIRLQSTSSAVHIGE